MYTKICMVFTVGFVGLNVHQFMASYEYVKVKINEFKGLVQEENDASRVNFISYLFYFAIPALYLFVLNMADFFILGLILLSLKFVFSALLGVWNQKRILSDHPYSKTVHLVSKCDNLINIFVSFAVVYILLFPF
ncbi:MAG: hypothetical protein HQK83_12845 [Fibrobacteria bacterium]|nr:hypothetical protein [Fibrobacteria bacterium]